MTSLEMEIIKILIEKLLLAGIFFIAGYYINKSFETYKSSLAREANLISQNQSLRNEIYKEQVSRRLKRLDEQMSEFYWPIYSRLQKDSAIWDKLSLLADGPGVLPKEISHRIENEVIIANHKEIIEILQNKMHLSDGNDELMAAINSYTRHVAVYIALRSCGIEDMNPVDYGEPFPENLVELFRNKIDNLVLEQAMALKSANEISMIGSHTAD